MTQVIYKWHFCTKPLLKYLFYWNFNWKVPSMMYVEHYNLYKGLTVTLKFVILA